jgi:hypothetical protein
LGWHQKYFGGKRSQPTRKSDAVKDKAQALKKPSLRKLDAPPSSTTPTNQVKKVRKGRSFHRRPEAQGHIRGAKGAIRASVNADWREQVIHIEARRRQPELPLYDGLPNRPPPPRGGFELLYLPKRPNERASGRAHHRPGGP